MTTNEGTFRLLTAVDLSQLPPPAAIAELDFEAILDEITADYRARYPEFSAALESDPVNKLLEAFAYREMLVRSRINDGIKACLVAYATGADLDHHAARAGVTRADGETDDRLRQRIVLAVEAIGAAGPAGAYRYHALEALPGAKDVSVLNPAPGQVLLTVLTDDGPGRPTEDQLKAVRDRLHEDGVKPVTVAVSVRPVEIITYEIDVGLYLYTGPDSEPVRLEAERQAQAFATRRHMLGNDITVSGLHAAVHVGGVQRVVVREPATLPLSIGPTQAAYCTGIRVTVDGRDE